MILVLGLAAALWGFGHAMNAPPKARWLMILLLYLAVVVVQIGFPEGHPVPSAFGGSRSEWLLLGILGLVVWGYSSGLKWLKARVRPENRATEPSRTGQSRAEIERYARHIVLREIGGPGQKALTEARVLVIGAGGLGSPALQYLAAAGVGTIGVIDDDVVAASNLQRQVIHTDDRIGMPKVFSAQIAMEALNPFVAVRPYHKALTAEIAVELFQDYDLILDGTDGVDVRYVINAAAIAAKKPLISAALSQWEGQISVYAPHAGTPCYRCVFPNPNSPGQAPSCAEGGVLGPLPGVVGAMMAVEAVKEITGAGDSLRGRILMYDALYADTRVISVPKRSECPDCA
jgi:molybdopterin/thiamine biosynthesis adenylyltransferase